MSVPAEKGREKRILAIAYACNPYKGSEQGVGWGWLGMIAQEHSVVCIVSQANQSDIERFCAQNPKSHFSKVEFVFVKHEWNPSLNKLFPPYYLWQFQRQWQRQAYKLARRLHEQHNFKICHLITYVGYRIPGNFYKLDCPFVWGPIGGLENTPWRLLAAMGAKGAFYYACRNLINTCQKLFLPKPKKAFKKASENGAVIAATSGIQREIKKYYNIDSIVICEVGPAHVRPQQKICKRSPGAPLRISWSGLHMPGKALPLLLNALHKLPGYINWQLDVMGDGPCRARWMQKAEKLNLNNFINWRGLIPRDNALAIMKNSHVFVITSLKDLTSTVLLEALSLGVPVICPDHCGFSDVVNKTCGRKIPISSPEKMVAHYALCLKTFFKHEDCRRQLSKGALQRATEFSWQDKKSQFIRILDQFL